MNYTAKVTNVEKVRHQASNSNFLEVAFTIFREAEKDGEIVKEAVAERRVGLDPKITTEQVKTEIAKHVETYRKEQEQAVVQAEQDKEDKNIADMKEELTGIELNNNNDA